MVSFTTITTTVKIAIQQNTQVDWTRLGYFLSATKPWLAFLARNPL